MFDFIHNNKKVVQIVLAIIFLPFAFFGVDSYFRSIGSGDDIAKVAGQPVTHQEFAQALQERLAGLPGLPDVVRHLLRILGAEAGWPGAALEVHPYAISTLGDIALAIGAQIQPYLNTLVPVIQNAAARELSQVKAQGGGGLVRTCARDACTCPATCHECVRGAPARCFQLPPSNVSRPTHARAHAG